MYMMYVRYIVWPIKQSASLFSVVNGQLMTRWWTKNNASLGDYFTANIPQHLIKRCLNWRAWIHAFRASAIRTLAYASGNSTSFVNWCRQVLSISFPPSNLGGKRILTCLNIKTPTFFKLENLLFTDAQEWVLASNSLCVLPN